MTYNLRPIKGFTLLEIIVVLAIMGILAGATTTMGFSLLNRAREKATFEEMQEIYKAIMGNPALGTFGFVGDMGRLPDNLTELADKTGQPDYDIKSTTNVPPEDSNGIKWGWNGPYLNIGADLQSYNNDEWGHAYIYDNVTGKITSNGLDGVPGTFDDVIYPPYEVSYKGDVTLTVFVKGTPNQYEGGGTTITIEVTIYSYDNQSDKMYQFGTINSVVNEGKSFSFFGLTQGFHPVKIKRDIFYTGIPEPDSKTFWLNMNIPPRGQIHQDVYVE
ncbi:MAG TPA: prepilin-type N-terminal cleavage/methylation domain-containing protein [Candidatus Brocadiia bacterium]|nr:prepilin-type N-terminal cleavage/methylation domain-containing protein [Candidatus Brocadiales bacterium]